MIMRKIITTMKVISVLILFISPIMICLGPLDGRQSNDWRLGEMENKLQENPKDEPEDFTYVDILDENIGTPAGTVKENLTVILLRKVKALQKENEAIRNEMMRWDRLFSCVSAITAILQMVHYVGSVYSDKKRKYHQEQSRRIQEFAVQFENQNVPDIAA